jgi:PLP dependent protein
MGPSAWKERLRANLALVREKIAQAAGRAGRSPADVRLIAVTKYADIEVVREVLAAGVADLGESHVQQLAERAGQCGPARLDWPGDDSPGEGNRPRWHMIGHLQRNKVKLLLPHARLIHSLDSQRLAETLEQQAVQLGGLADVLIEVNVSGEGSKQGVAPDAVAALAVAVGGCPHLRLRGLMTMAPYDPNPETARPHFARLRELLERLRTDGVTGPLCRELSMGMSQDYVVAVEEGATFVRVGSALFEGLAGVP